MKELIRNILLAVALPVALPLSAQQPLKLQGTVASPARGKVYLQKFIDRYYHTIDSATIAPDGRFAFSTAVSLPEVYGLTLSEQVNPYIIFLTGQQITVRLDSAADYRNTVVSGDSLQQLYVAYRSERPAIDSFIRSHPRSLVAAYVLYRDYSYRMASADIERHVGMLDTSLYRTPYVQMLRSLVKVRETVAIGSKAPDFAITRVDGKQVRLSDYIGKGYLLLDFWASWCAPCRRESPNIVKAYNKYHSRGFDIFAVSLDRSREAWLKAIAADHLDYVHASALKYWDSEPARLYGIRSIPSNVLIDPQGRIIAKNLRGEQLQQFLATLLP